VPLVSVHGRKLRYREVGAGRPGPPLLFIHGAGASSAIWLGVMHRLSTRRRCVALDLPGHGRSEGGAKTLDELRDAVGLLAATLCLGPSVLVGHSLGGLVAQAAALAWPDKVAALGLVTTSARIGVAPVVFENLEQHWPRWPAMVAETAYSPETPPDVRRRGASIAVNASQGQTIADFRICAATDLRKDVAGIRAPAVVVIGAHDLMTPPKWGEALASSIPSARLTRIERCGHMPMHEAADSLAAALSDL
jgi:pimeloyl-ACP methyl ester carboxylesterase